MLSSRAFTRIMVLFRNCLILFICSIGPIASITSTTRQVTAKIIAPGLRGEYFDNEDFSNLKFIRVDPAVDFNWGFGSPDPSIDPDRFSIRWTGQITAPATGNYIFVTHSDDGVRLWVNDQIVIDNFVSHPETEDRSSPIALAGGQSYNLRLEYYELTANAVIRLLWIRPGQTEPEVIPQTQLATPTTPNPAPVIVGISPNILPINASAFTLVVTGNSFLPGSVAQWNYASRPTMFVSNTQLNVSIPAGDLNNAGLVSITVVNPLPGGGTSNRLNFTVSGGYEADVSPRPNGNGNGTVTIADWTQVGRFSAGLDMVNPGSEFQRADCAPRNSLGDGRITVEDWVQAGRYASALDPVINAGGPGAPNQFAEIEAGDGPGDNGSNESKSNPLQSPLIGLFRFIQMSDAGHLRTIGLNTKTDGKVEIDYNADGDENAFGFSLSFDSTKWQIASAVKGIDAGNAVLLINTHSASNGRIGIALALSPGRKLGAGARHLIILTFRSRSGNISPYVSPGAVFADQPIMREVIDVKGNRLKAIYMNDNSALGKPALARAIIN